MYSKVYSNQLERHFMDIFLQSIQVQSWQQIAVFSSFLSLSLNQWSFSFFGTDIFSLNFMNSSSFRSKFFVNYVYLLENFFILERVVFSERRELMLKKMIQTWIGGNKSLASFWMKTMREHLFPSWIISFFSSLHHPNFLPSDTSYLYTFFHRFPFHPFSPILFLFFHIL